MRLLLDTHTIVWVMNDNRQLSQAARSAIASPRNPVYASAASIWEVSTKFRLGKFADAALLVDNPRKVLDSLEIEVISISLEHANLAGAFGHPHKDPFDRMLAAQALLERLTLVSADKIFDEYAVTRLW
jgi:PIN domain nuclease of toxin-antitoxin system